MKIEKKIILTKKELYEIILNTYSDGFEYCRDFEKIWKKNNNSQNKSVCTYTENKIKEIIK